VQEDRVLDQVQEDQVQEDQEQEEQGQVKDLVKVQVQAGLQLTRRR